MILDPRLVPWDAVVPGVVVAVPFAVAGFLLWKHRIAALSLLTISPIAGWAIAMWKMQGSLPKLVPTDAPFRAYHFAVAGAFVSMLGFWKRGCSGCMGPLARMIFFPALWLLIF
jgi:hypothetical protein